MASAPIGVPWHITVLSAAGKRVVWHGSSRDPAEIERLAAEAHRQMPGLPGPRIVTPAEVHPAMNVAGLYWRAP